MAFEVEYKDLMGRIGRLETPQGKVETPAIMPVVNPRLLLIEPKDLRKFGAEMLITNSYIIYRTPELREKALSEGVHRLLDVDLPVMTDSGAYQLSQYGKLEVTSFGILEFQMKIGSDIAVPLDIPTPPDVERETAKEEMEITIERLKEAKNALSKSDMLLAGPVQGSTFLDLRTECAKKASEIGFDVYAIGAVVPLMEGYRFSELVDIIIAVKQALPPCAPVHLFGAGHPMMLGIAVALGCDLFDSAAYALFAKDGRYLTASGTCKLEDLEYLPCACPICSTHTAHELKNLEDNARERLLAEHNLYVTFAELRRVKQAIRESRLWELIAMRCRAHPRLLDGLKAALCYVDLIEKFDPFSKGTFFYTGPESAHRPEVVRYRTRLLQLCLEGSILITSKKIALEKQFDNVFYLKAPFGPYPVEFGETYPIGQAEVLQNFDSEALAAALENVLRFVEANASKNPITFVYDKRWEHMLISKIARFAKIARFEDLGQRGEIFEGL